jgi:hypothetical protein
MTAMQRTAQAAAEAFARDAADHELTILHDDGLYRHLRFVRMAEQEDGTRKPASFYWFDLITWPGSLAINGDMEGFMFSRVTDMFEFFRGRRPNPGYWAEKLQGQPRVKAYSEEVFRQHVLDYYAEAVESGGVPKGLGRAIREQVIGNGDAYFEHGAREVLGEFEYGDATATARCSCGTVDEKVRPGYEFRWEAAHREQDTGTSHRVAWKLVEGWRFTDTWEWDFTDYSHQFLWCCSAIPWGIAKYDEAKAAAALETVSVTGGVL